MGRPYKIDKRIKGLWCETITGRQRQNKRLWWHGFVTGVIVLAIVGFITWAIHFTNIPTQGGRQGAGPASFAKILGSLWP
jgi:hypothetical protein